MELISQHTKAIMEGCKERARAAGLVFDDETLEYIVTNRDLIELNPKVMIPTLYDYWVHDVQVLQEKGRYELYPNNPYETVINTRPAISFYNDNNPDWLNVMIFYHVLGHIDFFQNNQFFSHTWHDDFAGQAMSDKRLIAMLRSEKGRWVDYVIEFARSIDNIVNFYSTLSSVDRCPRSAAEKKLDYYFDVFLQTEKKVSIVEYMKEVEFYNEAVSECNELANESFFSRINATDPEFEAMYRKNINKHKPETPDLLSFLCEHSPFLNKEANSWMCAILQVVRNTSLFFQPQIRTKILNEGWASYWHETLFLSDERIRGNEVGFARIHAKVTSMPRVGLNPYAIGMRLFDHIKDLGDRGKLSLEFDRLTDRAIRHDFDQQTNMGSDFIFKIRENYNDFLFINTFVDQDFVDRHQLFVAEKTLNEERMVWQYSIKSRKAKHYKQMLLDDLYHPPSIVIDPERSAAGALYLVHRFEGKPLVKEFISNTLLGIEYLWGSKVLLETNDVAEGSDPEVTFERVIYTMNHRKLSRQVT